MSIYAAVMWTALLVVAFMLLWIAYDLIAGWFADGCDLCDHLTARDLDQLDTGVPEGWGQ